MNNYEAEISDHFFNAEHPHYDALFGKKQPTKEAIYDAILKDAQTYCQLHDGDPQWYARDFMQRL